MIVSLPLLVASIFIFFGVGIVGSLGLYRFKHGAHWWGGIAAFMGSLAALVAGLTALFNNQSFIWEYTTSLPLLVLRWQLDPLAAFFLAIIGGVGCLVTLYSLGYMQHAYGSYSSSVFASLYNLFLAAMVLVVGADQAVFFLMAWELMSLASYFLVIFEYRYAKTVRSGLIYLIMTHVATVCITVLFLILASIHQSLDFSVYVAGAGRVPALLASVIFGLAVIGFGTKAGIIPFHVWLPEAHPAAPTPISALMSGVMIKLGIFMLIRVTLTFLPVPALWWGFTILMLGAISAVLGVLYALAEHDIKRLLAYHSVENIGIILLGLGSALVFQTYGLPELALISLVATLYHTLNHALFKTLLFCAAGVVVSVTGTRNMENYGGLIKSLPYTALFFLVGALAISGMIPFNGFVSEWLTFQTLFTGVGISSIFSRSLFIVAIAALALTGGLAAACFVKAFGITFLGRSRHALPTRPHEAGILMVGAMGMLAVLCGFFGIGASLVVPTITALAQTLLGMSHTAALTVNAMGVVQVHQVFGILDMSLLGWGLLLTIGAVAALTTWLSRQKVVRSATWNCGAPLTSRMEITATSFSRSLLVVFRGVLLPVKQVGTEYHDGQMQYFTKSHVVTLSLRNVYSHYIYRPLTAVVFVAAEKLKRIQSGNINVYVLYIFLMVCGLLIWAVW